MSYLDATAQLTESLNAHYFRTDCVQSIHGLRDAIGLENLVDDSARPQSSKIIKAGDIGEKPVRIACVAMDETHNHSHVKKAIMRTLSFSALIIAQLAPESSGSSQGSLRRNDTGPYPEG
jgi:hypothetical protein